MNAADWVPEEFLKRVRSGHSAGVDLLRHCGFPDDGLERVQVAEAVESHRWAWKPEHVRLVLLAESHVYTANQELAISYAGHPWLTGVGPVPTICVRLIYCLAYGEPVLCPLYKQGTPQFWGIFGSLAGTQPKHLPNAHPQQRFSIKIETLRKLKSLGVCLLDSSLHGIYAPKGSRLDANVTSNPQTLWLHHYGRALLDHVQPERVIAIGKGVHGSLSDRIHFDNWIYQPQGTRSESQAAYNNQVLSDLRKWLWA